MDLSWDDITEEELKHLYNDLELLLSHYKLYGTQWDDAEPYMEEIHFIYENAISNYVR